MEKKKSFIFKCQKTCWKEKEYNKASFKKKQFFNHALKHFVIHAAILTDLDIRGMFENWVYLNVFK